MANAIEIVDRAHPPQERTGRRGRPPLAGGYRAVAAQQRAATLSREARHPPKLAHDGPLWSKVVELLREAHCPEQIAGILRRMHPKALSLHVSHETLYTALYALPRGELRRELIGCLRQGKKRRRPRSRGTDRRGQIPDMTSIPMRPPEIKDRVSLGHWEGDLIKGAHNASAVGTLVERSKLFVALCKMQNATAPAAVDGFASVLNRIDAQRRLSLTYDQGKEMSQHAQLSALTGVKVYFADPHSPWQRGINENTNGLLRQFLPKGRDLSQFTQAELDAVAWKLNTRPRKSLDWKCPAELFMPDDFDFKKHFHHLVALGP